MMPVLGATAATAEALGPWGWAWYFAADATCVGGYAATVALEPACWRRAAVWWVGSLLLPAAAPLLPTVLLGVAAAAGVAAVPLLLRSRALRFVYGMAGLFRAMRLLTLLRDRVAMGTAEPGAGSSSGRRSRMRRAVLRAAILWGYHDVRSLRRASCAGDGSALRRTARCIGGTALHAGAAGTAHLLLSRRLPALPTAGGQPGACWTAAVRLALGTLRLYCAMGSLSGAAEAHLHALKLAPRRAALHRPFAAASVAGFWRGHWNTPVQELLSAVVAASGARGRRRSAVWLLSLALHLCGLGFLLLPCPAAAFAGHAAPIALFFLLQPCLVGAERAVPGLRGVWWTRLAVLGTAQLVVRPTLPLAG